MVEVFKGDKGYFFGGGKAYTVEGTILFAAVDKPYEGNEDYEIRIAFDSDVLEQSFVNSQGVESPALSEIVDLQKAAATGDGVEDYSLVAKIKDPTERDIERLGRDNFKVVAFKSKGSKPKPKVFAIDEDTGGPVPTEQIPMSGDKVHVRYSACAWADKMNKRINCPLYFDSVIITEKSEGPVMSAKTSSEDLSDFGAATVVAAAAVEQVAQEATAGELF